MALKAAWQRARRLVGDISYKDSVQQKEEFPQRRPGGFEWGWSEACSPRVRIDAVHDIPPHGRDGKF